MKTAIKLGCGLLLMAIHFSVKAGSGFYYGIDGVAHTLETATQTQLILSLPPTESTFRDNHAASFSDWAVYAGYLHKRRRTDRFFLAPELFAASLDSDETIYGTSLKIGMVTHRWAPFISVGVSRIDVFKQNKLHLGLGTQVRLSDRIALNLEWLRFDTIKEHSVAVNLFGTQTLTTITDTERDIDSIRLGFTFYLHE